MPIIKADEWIKIIEAALKTKAPQTYHELQKAGKLDHFLKNTCKHMMESYNKTRTNAFSELKKTRAKDSVDNLIRYRRTDNRVLQSTIKRFLEFSDPIPTIEETIPVSNKHNQDTYKESEAQSINDITPTEKKELTPEEKYQKVADVVLRAAKRLLEIKYPHLMKKKDTQLHAGLDPEIMTAAIDLAGYYIEGGARSFMDFSKNMIADIGEEIRPYLKSLYIAVRNYPGLDNTGMNTEAELDEIN